MSEYNTEKQKEFLNCFANDNENREDLEYSLLHLSLWEKKHAKRTGKRPIKRDLLQAREERALLPKLDEREFNCVLREATRRNIVRVNELLKEKEIYRDYIELLKASKKPTGLWDRFLDWLSSPI